MVIKFKDNTKKIFESMQEKKNDALFEIGAEVEKTIKLLTPIDTGDLRKSSDFEIEKNSVIVGIPKNSLGEEYATLIEIGDLNRKAQPYVKPGFVKNKNKIKDITENYYKTIK